MLIAIDQASIFKNQPNHVLIQQTEDLFEASFHDNFDLLWLGLRCQSVHKRMLPVEKAFAKTVDWD